MKKGSKQGPAPACKKQGFTVLEMIMVILIIGILTVIISSNITGLYPAKLSGAAERLASDIRYAQSLALSKHLQHKVVFEVSAERYAVYCFSGSWELVADPLNTGNSLVVDYTTDSRWQGIKIDATNLLSDTIEFDSTLGIPMGIPDAEPQGEILLNYGNTSRKVSITKNTGRVSIPSP